MTARVDVDVLDVIRAAVTLALDGDAVAALTAMFEHPDPHAVIAGLLGFHVELLTDVAEQDGVSALDLWAGFCQYVEGAR